ncbi:MAG: phosphonopyruvate decarboxylase [Clostridium sp.]|jgi:phosphonopyruvate decarboxylase|nr:phosphonopyruvate decarboxylase [Clostridium sp.]
MKATDVLEVLEKAGIDFFAGVPDSLLRPFCDAVFHKYGQEAKRHFVAHNEGGAVGCAAGYHLATGKIPCVYMQNSGVGNAVNPVASLTSPYVYGIPVLYIIGWRGQPGIPDEPQHQFQGMITETLLNVMELAVFRLTAETSVDELAARLERFRGVFRSGQSAAILVESGALSGEKRVYANDYIVNREAAMEHIASAAREDMMVTSTGKISRELFEIRERTGRTHDRDFLTVGSMGHDSMIALGIALRKPERRVWCVQGDGAFLMHLGALAEVGSLGCKNMRYIVLNNAAHESVGGLPTCAGTADLAAVAAACGIRNAFRAASLDELDKALDVMKNMAALSFLEVRCALGSRKDLGRPATAPAANKTALMKVLEEGGGRIEYGVYEF